MNQPDHLEPLAKQRRRLVVGRLATRISVGEELLTILDERRAIGETVEELISSLSTLVDLTSANQSPSPDPTRNPNKGDRIPGFQPAWAANKLAQIDRQLYELAGSIDGWCNRPSNPERPDTCHQCGRRRSRDDLYCRQCGTPTRTKRLRDVIEQCEHCGTGFVPMRSDARYCSGACRAAASRARVTDNPQTHSPSS